MTVEQLVRDQLDRATQHVPGGPDLEAAVSTGRRRRRNRRVGLASAAVAVVVAAPLAVSAFLPEHQAPRTSQTQAADQPPAPPAAPAPPATDHVPGTDIDETMAAVVAEHLDLPDAADIYTSDSVHPGPMADADFARATDWIATYELDGQQVDVSMGYADAANLACGGDGCTGTPMAGGELQLRESRGWHKPDNAHKGQWDFVTQFVSGSFYVRVNEVIVAPSQEVASSHRTLDATAVAALVTDPRLTFPRP